MTDAPETPAQQFRRRRRALNLSQAAIAERLGYDRTTIGEYERGGAAIPPVIWLALDTIEREASAATEPPAPSRWSVRAPA